MEKFEDIRAGFFNEKSDKTHKTPSFDVLKTLQFNEATKWTNTKKTNELFEYAKEPPLGVKDLHRMGVNGEGVNVAIIDQPLAVNHPEYKGKVKAYKKFAPDGYEMKVSSMHGPAVVSLLVGENIGVAPKVNVFYAATPSWLGDAIYEVQAVKWIIELNKTLPCNQKIKFISVSAAPGDPYMRTKNSELWLECLEEAKQEGICVVDCTPGNRFVTVGYVEPTTGEFCYGFPDMPMIRPQVGEVHVPNSVRTVAESYDNEKFSYTYCGKGGLSWGIPYAVGVLCLGQQVNPNLSAFELKEMLIESASKNGCVIDPKAFIEMVKAKKEEKTSEE